MGSVEKCTYLLSAPRKILSLVYGSKTKTNLEIFLQPALKHSRRKRHND